MTMINAYDGTVPGGTSPEDREMIARRERLLGPAYRLFYERPVHFVRAEGMWLFDAQGNRYLDAYNNVASVGHCHPHVVDAICRQARLLNTHTRYLEETILSYAERLLAKFPAQLSHVMFTCTGSEANDLALRVARSATGHEGVIVTGNAYHGVTTATAEASPSLGPAVARRTSVRTVELPVIINDDGEELARRVADAIVGMAADGIRPAALLFDTIFSSDGLRPEPAGFLRKSVNLIREAGGLFIADEVQAGFGRTGVEFWGFARHGLTPDIVTMGKPMGNGHPVAGLVAKPQLLAKFGKAVRYFNTFGGNAVSCAAGSAVLDVIENEGLLENARMTGAYLTEGLRNLPGIGPVRGAGLFVAVDMLDKHGVPAPDRAARLVNGMRDRRILISATGPVGHTLKIRPPLVARPKHVDFLLREMAQLLPA